MPKLNNFSEISRPDQDLFQNTQFGIGNLLVVEDPSSEKWSHPCAKPKRFYYGRVYYITPSGLMMGKSVEKIVTGYSIGFQ